MAFSELSSSALPPPGAWESLVLRSIAASKVIGWDTQVKPKEMVSDFLRDNSCLDDFLRKAPSSMMFWFFQRRDAFLSQKTMTKWSRNALDDYVLLSAAPGFVSRDECFFVSHFWRTREHPDPDGECLRLLQAELRPQHWSYIWVDWTCIPQSPHSQAEATYFRRSLETMSGIIRNCGFAWFYPPFEAGMCFLYEFSENALTSYGDIEATPDIREFKDHVQEMVRTSVRSVLDKYSYRCTHDRDKAFLTSWLELLVLLTKLRIEILDIRRFMDLMTWFPTVKVNHLQTADDVLQLNRYQGTLIRHGKRYLFTPFPEWVSLPTVILTIIVLLTVSERPVGSTLRIARISNTMASTSPQNIVRTLCHILRYKVMRTGRSER